jgi:pyruvate carboxylase
VVEARVAVEPAAEAGLLVVPSLAGAVEQAAAVEQVARELNLPFQLKI